jgi:putative nucleotide binding protein
MEKKRDHREERIREEHVKILDYLPEGITSLPVYKRYPVAQTVGCAYFVLLEVTPKQGVHFKAREKLYVGEGERDKVRTIKKRIKYEELTSTAKNELPDVLEEIVIEGEKKFVEFFNKAKAISLKHHQLELLPKVGKKQLFKILEEREKEEFKSFKDVDKRVKGLPEAHKLIVDRVVEEIMGDVDHRLFVPDFGREK